MALGRRRYGATRSTGTSRLGRADLNGTETGLQTGRARHESSDVLADGQQAARVRRSPWPRACARPSGQGAGDTVIAEQIARNNTADVILGGGLSRFEPDDQAALQGHGYTVLGSFGGPALTDQTAASQRVPTRADLARGVGP